jgi:hypothetical protein
MASTIKRAVREEMMVKRMKQMEVMNQPDFIKTDNGGDFGMWD